MSKSLKHHFVINMLLMTVTMLIIRVIGMAFNIYFTSVIGAAETGMYHLVFSAYGFMITFSVAGTGLAATRLVTEVGKSRATAVRTVKKCLVVCGVFSLTATVVVLCISKPLGKVLIGNSTSSLALAVLAASLVPVGASAVFRGYFMAVRRVGTVTLGQLIEEMSQIVITLWFLKVMKGTPHAYMTMLAGISASAFAGCCFDFCAYMICISRDGDYGDMPSPHYANILSISLPITAGALLRSALVLAENMLIPKTLAKFGVADALSEYGIIKGMSIPLIMFPTVITTSLSSLLVTELSERNAEHKPNGIRYIAGKACCYTLYFGFFVAGAIVMWHGEIASRFYRESGVSKYFGALALLVVPMYLDTVVDGMLKGLNQQMSSLRYNIADSLLRVCLILCLIPNIGSVGYIAMLYISEFFNLSLSLGRLVRTSGLKLRLRYVFVPLAGCIAAGAIAVILCNEMRWQVIVYLCTYVFVMWVSEHKS